MDADRGQARAGVLPDREERLTTLFRAQRRRLRGLAYRLTGNAGDADDVVQVTYTRLVARPPHALAEDAEVWLTRVATNLGIDALRRRRRRGYDDPWLPSPVEADTAESLREQPSEQPDPETRYGVDESITFAFLLALE